MFVVIRKEGGSRVISVTRFVPNDWQAVEIESKTDKKGNVILTLEKVK